MCEREIFMDEFDLEMKKLGTKARMGASLRISRIAPPNFLPGLTEASQKKIDGSEIFRSGILLHLNQETYAANFPLEVVVINHEGTEGFKQIEIYPVHLHEPLAKHPQAFSISHTLPSVVTITLRWKGAKDGTKLMVSKPTGKCCVNPC